MRGKKEPGQGKGDRDTSFLFRSTSIFLHIIYSLFSYSSASER